MDDVGLPDGCQVEQVHSLQRHAQRNPTGSFDDGINDENFAAKVFNFTSANPNSQFTGPLTFLNTYVSKLTGIRVFKAVWPGGVVLFDRMGHRWCAYV